MQRYREEKKKSWWKTVKRLLKTSFILAALFLLISLLYQILHDLSFLEHHLYAVEKVQQIQGHGLHNLQTQTEHTNTQLQNISNQVQHMKVKINGIEVNHQVQPQVQMNPTNHGTNHGTESSHGFHIPNVHVNPGTVGKIVGVGIAAGALLMKGLQMIPAIP